MTTIRIQSLLHLGYPSPPHTTMDLIHSDVLGYWAIGQFTCLGTYMGVRYALRKLVSWRSELKARILLDVLDTPEVEDLIPIEAIGVRNEVDEGVDVIAVRGNEDADVVIPWLGGESLCDVTDPCFSLESHERGGARTAKALRRIRRGCRNAFVKWWVNWGKSQFPSAWRGITVADRTCITNALCREMRTQSVRDADIQRVKDLIVLGIVTPSIDELEAARMEASYAVQERQGATRGLWNWFGGRGLQVGQVK